MIPVDTKLGTRVARSCPCALLNQAVEASPGDMRSSPVTIRRAHSALVHKFFPHLQINCHNGGMDFPPFCLWLLAAHPSCWSVRCQNGEQPGDFNTPAVCRMSTARYNRPGLASMIKNNESRQGCGRLGSESLQTSKVSPASDILSEVSYNVEPHVRSLCGSSDHLSPLSRHQGRSVRRAQRGPVVTFDSPCRKTPLRRRGGPG